MQGWAKRWFSLSPAGVLSYSTGQNTVIRGSIQILISSITYSPKLNQIHIDSGTMIYHLKTLTQDDYTLWSSALKEIKDNSDDVLRAIPAEYNAFNSATNSKRNSYRGMSMYGNNYQLDRKLKAEVEQGLDFSSDLQSNAIAFVKAVDELKHFVADLVIDDNEKMLDIFYKIDLGKQKMISGLDDQLHQWQNIQNAISSKRRSGSNSPKLASAQETALMEQSEHPPRTSSVYSELSGYSETFFDAEDIVLSAAEDEDEEDSHIDDEENSSDEDDTDSHPDSEILKLTSMADCNRRSKLPSPSLGDPGSALSVFKKNIGKDLSTIAMPISMNEPLSMLQKACEELEYSDILDKAAGLTDPIERLMYVTVFSISAYASSQYRTGRKPFNPMMNETYECIRPDRGFRFISEKVSHNPLIVAAHAESKNFKYWQSTQIKSKFWGKSMEFMTEGNFHIVLTGHDDHFVFFKPSSWMKNMIAGEKYLEHSGECKVMNQKTGDYATVVFKEGTGGGLFSTPTKRNDVIATLHNKDGAKVRRIVGKWSDKLLEEVNMDKNKLNVLWSAQPSGVPECEKYFGFTRFATELNEITSLEKDKIPITDTRLRPDQRLYENGKVDEADEEKLRIEQKQRERRKMFELSGTEWKPRWFTCEDGEWQYAGQYWPTRESGKWPSDLFEIW
ncbi:Oxysterol-binding protein-domain-containing protein [Pilobolus umbonatus]|nr:Oxysterol-binding protein-domain-containing protein [Pilobolus umbonatus]